MAKETGPEKVSFRARLRQIGTVFSFTAKRDKKFVPLVIAAALLPLLVGTLLVTLGWSWVWLVVGVMLALLLVMVVLSVRSNKAMMIEAEGQPGASASIVENMRGDWRVTPGLASTTQFDFVHLVIGRAGVILLAEGNPGRIKGLLGQEKRRLSKVIGSAELRDFVVGSGEGEVPIAKLRMTLMQLPVPHGKDVNALDLRLKALSARPQMPKGAIPKNMRPPPAWRGAAAGPAPAPGRVRWRRRAATTIEPAARSCRPPALLVHDQRRYEQGQQETAQQRRPSGCRRRRRASRTGSWSATCPASG